MTTQTRRQFLRNSLATAFAFSGLEVLAQDSKTKIQDEFSYLNVYDSIIDSSLKYFEERLGHVPEKNLIKAMIAVESGSLAHRKTVFPYDPMQVASDGVALNVLKDRGENTQVIGDFSCLDDNKYATRKNGQWDYTNTKMSAEESIFCGIGWLIHKAVKNYGKKTTGTGLIQTYKIKSGDVLSSIASQHNTTVESVMELNPEIKDPDKIFKGQEIRYRESRTETVISEWRPWPEAMRRYKGGSRKYLKKVIKIKFQLDRMEAGWEMV